MGRAGRPREFDVDGVVERAAFAFWRDGYGRTSTDALRAATGLSTSSLYNTFGSKRDLYLAALDGYAERIGELLLAPLETGHRGVADVDEYFDRLLATQAADVTPCGCLLANALGDASTDDTEVSRRALAYRDRLRAGFERALRRAVALGELDADGPTTLAATLTHAVIGALVSASSARRPVDDDVIAALRSTIARWRTP